jgi:hypothetical protein
MATVFGDCTTEEQRTVVLFLWIKGLSAKDIDKEIFPVYGSKCLSRKAVHSWVEKRGKLFADVEVETEVRKWPRQQSKDYEDDFLSGGYSEMITGEGRGMQCEICTELFGFFWTLSIVWCVEVLQMTTTFRRLDLSPSSGGCGRVDLLSLVRQKELVSITGCGLL